MKMPENMSVAAPAVSSPAAAAERATTAAAADTRTIMRIGLWSLLLGLGGFLLWATFAPLDEGVPTQGIVAIDTKRKTVQHQQGGIVRAVMVGEGDLVREGQVLLQLNDGTVRANYESIRQRYLAVRATEGRLLAEQAGQDQIRFHPDLLNAHETSLVQQHLATQRHLFRSRREALVANLAAIDQSIAAQQAQMHGYEAMLESRGRQLALFREELVGVRDLVSEGYAPRSKQMEMERSMADITSVIAELQAGVQRVKRTTEELGQRARVQRLEYQKEVSAHLADVRREVQADAETLAAVTAELQRTEIRAPATGQVVGLAVQTVGAVIQPGQKLMDIVPENAPLLLETRIAPHLIDRISVGAPVDVRFSAFAHSPQLVVGGRIVSLSRDVLAEPESKEIYYLSRVEITQEGMRTLGKRQLQPGMQVEVVVKTGERSLLTYLLHPLMRRIAASMKEE